MNVWAKTLFIINYDENDGHFDHVVPPTPPPGTAGEYVYSPASVAPPLPTGLGFRVPCLLVSPFTRGGLVSSSVFDHTSVIQLLETKFNVKCPNISDWRRAIAGNLIDAIALPQPWPPSPQVMPTQETTPSRATPSGPIPSSDVPEVKFPVALAATGVAAAGLVALRNRRANG